MKRLSVKQPTHSFSTETPHQHHGRISSVVRDVRSPPVAPLSMGKLLQRQCACGGGCPRCLSQKFKASEGSQIRASAAETQTPNQASQPRSQCPTDGSVGFRVTGDDVKGLAPTLDLSVETARGVPALRMTANRFNAEKTVITRHGEPDDLNEWQVGFTQTIHKNSRLHACYAAPTQPANDPRSQTSLKTGMLVQDIGELAGGDVLDGDSSTPRPFYSTPAYAALPNLRRGAAIAMDDQPEVGSIPIFFDEDAANGACLTKVMRWFEATAFVIAERSSDAQTCFLWHIHWGFLQTASLGHIAIDATGGIHLGNYSLQLAALPIVEGMGQDGYASKLDGSFANTVVSQPSQPVPLASPCPARGEGCVALPSP